MFFLTIYCRKFVAYSFMMAVPRVNPDFPHSSLDPPLAVLLLAWFIIKIVLYFNIFSALIPHQIVTILFFIVALSIFSENWWNESFLSSRRWGRNSINYTILHRISYRSFTHLHSKSCVVTFSDISNLKNGSDPWKISRDWTLDSRVRENYRLKQFSLVSGKIDSSA